MKACNFFGFIVALQFFLNYTAVQAAALPPDFFYKGEPITSACMDRLLCVVGNPAEIFDLDAFYFNENKYENSVSSNDIFNWTYLLTLPCGDHVVHGYCWPAGASGKFSMLCVLRRIDNCFHFRGHIASGGNHSSMVQRFGSYLNNTFIYQQTMSSGLLFDFVIARFPDLAPLVETANLDDLCYGESGFIGSGSFKVVITKEEISEPGLDLFSMADFGDVAVLKEYGSIAIQDSSPMTAGEALNILLSEYYSKGKKDLTLVELKDLMKQVLILAQNKEN